ncbi:ASCH domain-containing protein [Clostridium sp. UBA3887]|uniref:ASCH domain-containing protein n=1 Tax=Clostridium sp. UBA3887 TaxID=1946356 RepID=UPI0032169D77
MIYKMKLRTNEFDNIKNGSKKIEVRLYDEKRRKIKSNDYIIFYKQPLLEEKVCVRVDEIIRFNTFKEVYTHFPKKKFGYSNLSNSDILDNIYSIYTKQQEIMFGVIVIQFTVIENMI